MTADATAMAVVAVMERQSSLAKVATASPDHSTTEFIEQTHRRCPWLSETIKYQAILWLEHSLVGRLGSHDAACSLVR